jgi:hypothetical protein
MGTIQIDGESTLEDVRLWCREHDGIIEERWDNQFRFNDGRKTYETEMKDAIKDIHAQLSKQQSRLFFIAGGAALLGTAVPQLMRAAVLINGGP